MRTIVFGRSLKRTALRLLVWVVVCVVGFKLSLVHVRVNGISMLPTCPDQSVYWVNRLAYLGRAPQRGDVVAISFSRAAHAAGGLEPPQIMLVKRIIGLPGETVAFARGRVLINGEVLDEPYENAEKFPCDWNLAPVKLAPDEYFVVGDNRTMPWQDHTFGRCKRNQIVGKVFL